LLGNKALVTTLLFRGSEHGWNPKDFHSRCDNKGPTIILYKVKDGDCFGGFTKAQWRSIGDPGEMVDDENAFLFNLSRSRRYYSRYGQGGIWCYAKIGPAFGTGRSQELTYRGPVYGQTKIWSHAE
jgi:hypothetical protein